MYNHSSVSITKFTYSSWINSQMKLYSLAANAVSCIPLQWDGYILRRDGCIMRSDGCILRSDRSQLKWTDGAVDKVTGFQPRGCGFETNCYINSFLLYFCPKKSITHLPLKLFPRKDLYSSKTFLNKEF